MPCFSKLSPPRSTFAHILAMLTQLQSPLFRLPREIRDEIYQLYTYDNYGFHHVFSYEGVGQLRQADGQRYDIPLKASCKRVAQELEGVALVSNAIHFYGSDHRSNSILRSNALRFKRLIEYVNMTKWRMLLRCAASCITPELLETVERQYPDHGFTAIYQRAILDAPNPRNSKGFTLWHPQYEKYSWTGHCALQTCLELAAAHPRFRELAAGACSPMPEEDAFGKRPLFKERSHLRLLDWKPEPYHIPSDAELDNMEALLLDADDTTQFEKSCCTEWLEWNFSACAVAIHSIQRLPANIRTGLREIVLHEDCATVVMPERHLEGFLPFIRENPKLRIERRVRGYHSAFVSRWSFVPWIKWTRCGHQGFYHMDSMMEWLQAAHDITSRCLPAKPFSIVFEDDGDAAVFAQLGKAIRMGELMLARERSGTLTRPPTSADELYMQVAYSLPWHLPDWLPDLFDDVANGLSAYVSYEGEICSADAAQDIESPPNQSLDQWNTEWSAHMMKIPLIDCTAKGGFCLYGFGESFTTGWSRKDVFLLY